jgi:acyl transferase domain-containing protein
MTEVIRAERKPIVWMFSGQGAQYFQMGRALYHTNQAFRFWMDRLDQVAANYAGQSIVEMLYDEKRTKSQPFEQTLYTHPALFMVQYSLAKTLLAEDFPPPDYLFGASLGEFVAAALADVADVETMLFDIIKQARLFDSHCSGGAMLAVIDDVDIFQTNPVFSGDCELAGVNFDRCFVVSGLRSQILTIAGQLKQQDIIHQLLPVSVAFHSSLVEAVRETFSKMFAGSVYRSARIPVVSCAVSTDGNEEGERFSSAYWWRVIRQPIQFRQALAGFHCNHPQAVYLDLGPSGNMATFTKYNLPESVHKRIMPIMTPFGNDHENISAARDRLRTPA